MLSRSLLLIALSLSTACGSSPDNAEDAAPASSSPDGSTAPSPIPEDGSKAAPPASDPANAMLVPSISELPFCATEGRGKLVYVADTQQFQHCDGYAWNAIDLKGEKGEKGDPGTAGKDGINGAPGNPGKDGTDNHIVATIHCRGSLPSPLGYSIEYDAVLMASGDVFADASVNTGGNDAHASAFYSANQNGASDAAVTVGADIYGAANYGWWAMSLNRQSLIVTVKYNDAEMPGGVETWLFSPDKCVKTTHP